MLYYPTFILGTEVQRVCTLASLFSISKGADLWQTPEWSHCWSRVTGHRIWCYNFTLWESRAGCGLCKEEVWSSWPCGRLPATMTSCNYFHLCVCIPLLSPPGQNQFPVHRVCTSYLFWLFLCVVVLEIKPHISLMLGKHITAELHSQAWLWQTEYSIYDTVISEDRYGKAGYLLFSLRREPPSSHIHNSCKERSCEEKEGPEQKYLRHGARGSGSSYPLRSNCHETRLPTEEITSLPAHSTGF